MPEYLLPDVGEGLTEAEIVSWKVKVGDVIDVNDVVVEIETAKSLVELPSPYAGTVTGLLVPEGETVPVGTPIIVIGDPSEPLPDAGTGPGDMVIDLSNPAASGSGEGESLVGRMKADRGPMRRPRKGSASPSTESAAATQMQVQGAFAPGGAQSDPVVEADEPAVPATPAPPLPADERVLAKPPVRKLAKELGVDLASCTASGPYGTVTRDDVLAQGRLSEHRPVEEGALAPVSRPAARPAGTRETREPIKGVRKMMGAAMVESAFTIPHVTEWVTLDVTRTTELVERLRDHRELRDVKVSPLLVIVRAVLLAMRRTPEINSLWDEAAGEVVLKHYVNLGIAAATPRGLVVPNVKDAQDLTLRELAEALGQLTATAREGRTQPAEMSGGTFTITNVGVFGVDAGTPIINPGESAILCVGAISKRPWVDEVTGEIVARDVTTLALSFDHRHIDGEKGSRFLADVASILRDPASALLF
ncbi:2-oxo acid dehydrogenase subunit E2 [Nocardioides sp. IC4_145]|uniref:dihydrolipoamide acetyltransferase family protein n=1 Tax=Nocardioides sp. IC4_145 TaxID=2714037 RepID=UPI00140C166F|nr:dihydrolipoamide acetyltransferase family protein [Nocardioides sp. IC4_145]NHC21972.1 2-oxo acid dehydrogenase subunit E2 [Nocardioides sp. IC4_145]